MSNIPTSAMPRAGNFDEGENSSTSVDASDNTESAGALGQIADKAREYPKTAIAAGAAVAAGVVAAATLASRSRSGKDGTGSSKKK